MYDILNEYSRAEMKSIRRTAEFSLSDHKINEDTLQ